MWCGFSSLVGYGSLRCVVFALARAKRHTIKKKYHAAAGKSTVSESPTTKKIKCHLSKG
jgi:hypothetical protein